MLSPWNLRLYEPMKMFWVMETSGMGPPLSQMRPYLLEKSHVYTET